MDTDALTPSPLTVLSMPPAKSYSSTTPFPGREDCWAEDATSTLIEAWGERYLELNRGNLRQQHWQEVADSVNAVHGHNVKSRRTDVQCKNRIDTIKKKYKIEKARVSDSDGSYTSPWPFFERLDSLIGNNFPPSSRKYPLVPDLGIGGHRVMTQSAWNFSSPVPVGPRSATRKRPSPATASFGFDDSSSRRKFSAFAAVVAAAQGEEDEEDVEYEETERSGSRSSMGSKSRKADGEIVRGYRELAKGLNKFGEIYQRVEALKRKQMVELEKQRMQFVKDLEFQRMQLFMETQVRLQKLKRAKRSSCSGKHLVTFICFALRVFDSLPLFFLLFTFVFVNFD